jgi:adenosylhomocysteine nucleosidase
VKSFRHRVRGYDRIFAATAFLVTLEITGFATASSGDEAHTALPSPLRGRNPDLAQYSDTPTLHDSARPDSRTRTGTKGAVTAGPIGILGIPEETAQLVASLKNPEERSLGGIRVILGKLANQSVVLCQVGFGKVNAGTAAALLIQKFSPSAIIFTGNAGALNPNYIQGDVVLATDLAEYDFGQLTNGSFAPWQTRSPISRINNPLWFHPASWLLSAARKSASSVQLIRADTRPDVRDPKICEGAIVTGDTFVSDASKVEELRTRFNADGVEMEGAAVAQICCQYEIPLLVIRSITDRADGSSYRDYHSFVRIAAQNSSAFVIAILHQLQSQGGTPTINPKEVEHWLLAFELAFSEGSPYALEFGDLHTLPYDVNEQISAVVLQKVISISLDELAAAKIGFHIMPGAHQHDPIVPSGQLEIATDEVRARATLDVIGYLAQQGLVIGSSKGSAGSRMGLEILGRNGDLLKDRARLSELWNAFLTAEPKLLTGFSGIRDSDQTGILIIDTGGAWLTSHASDLSLKFSEIGLTIPVSLSGTLFSFSYIEAENDWTSRADGADYIDDLVWLGFKRVAEDIPRHKRAIEQTIRDAIAEFAPVLKGRSTGTLGLEPLKPEPLLRRQEYPNPRE